MCHQCENRDSPGSIAIRHAGVLQGICSLLTSERFYEDTTVSRPQSAAYCTLCHSPLTLCCSRCAPNLSSLAAATTTSTTTTTTATATTTTTTAIATATTSFPSKLWSEEGERSLARAAHRHKGRREKKETPRSAVDERVRVRRSNKHEKNNNTDNAARMSSDEGTEVMLENTEGSDQGSETASSVKLCSSKDGDGTGVESEKEARNEHSSAGTGSVNNTREENKDRVLGVPCCANNVKGNRDTVKTEAWREMVESHSGKSQCLPFSDSLTQADPLTIRTQTHNSGEGLQCDRCGASFLLPSMLEEHRRAVSCQAHPHLKTHTLWTASAVTHDTQSVFSSGHRETGSSVFVTGGRVEPGHDNPLFDLKVTGNPEDVKQGKTLDAVCEETLLPDNSNLYDCDTDVESDLAAELRKSEPENQQLLAVAQQRNLEESNRGIQEDSDCRLQEGILMHTDVGLLRKTDRVSGHGCQHRGQIFSSSDELASHVDTPCQSSHTVSHTGTVTHSSCSLLTTPQGQGLQYKITSKCCEHCGKTFLSPEELDCHKLSHSDKQQLSFRPASKKTPRNKSDLRYACSICSMAFATLTTLRQHKKKEHQEESVFQCRFCGKVLCNMQTRATHERIHTGAKPFQCSQCPSTFRSSSNLRAHLRTHSGHTPYLCPQCGRGFKEITHLKRHLVSHSGQKPYKCQQCGKAYVHATSLKEHLLSHCSSPKAWVCHQCGKTFINAKNLKAHFKTHADCGVEGKRRAGAGRCYACQVCGATYRQASSLSRHKKLHKKTSPAHVCADCGKTFRDQYELNRHSSIHSGFAPFQCAQCPRSYRDSSSYRRHMLSHDQSTRHACPHCQKTYTDSKTLRRHIQTHGGIRPHACSQCSKTFFTMWTLRLHLQQHSQEGASQGRSHICQQCGATYLHASSLVRHQRLHEAAMGRGSRYQCAQCSRSFGDSSHLKRHLLSHSGEKPFVCSACGKAYADSHTLKDHMQVHTGVRSFICEMCGKAFYNAKTLKEHARSHSDHRPFQCSLCSAAYKHLSGLISHRRLHTGVRPFSCGECGKAFKDYTCYKRHLLTHSHHKPHVCQHCGKAYKDLKNLRHHQTQLHGNNYVLATALGESAIAASSDRRVEDCAV